MKTMRTLLLLGFSSLLAVISCKDGKNDIPPLATSITIDAKIESVSRVSDLGFEANDEISIYAWTGVSDTIKTPLVVDNIINRFDGNKWNSSEQMLWLNPVDAHHFIGVYPSRAIADLTEDHYTTPLDLLVAQTEESFTAASNEGSGVVALTFKHVMARFDVNLSYRNQWGGVPTVEKVEVEAKKPFTINYLNNAIAIPAEAVNETVVLDSLKGNIDYSLIVAPQVIHKVLITIEGKVYTYENVEGIDLRQGMVRNLKLIVGRDEIQVGGTTIDDWIPGDPLGDGEAQE